MTCSISGRLAAATALLLVGFGPAQSADPAGVLWESTSQMVMTGMPFSPPPRTLKVCTAAVWTAPPPGGDRSCVNTDFQRVGNKVTWKMECTGGDMPMTGTGEITFDGTDAYTGAINATADGVNVTINLSGKKIGTCDNPISG
jgi:hypothetical protein